MSNKSFDYTCIFGGGAIRGMSYVGTIKAFEELGIKPNTISGSSVGAVFATLLSVGYTADELKDIFMQVSYELFKDIHFGFGNNFAFSKGVIFLDWLRELIESKFYGDKYKKGENPPITFADLDSNLVIIATDLTNFKYKEFSKIETPNVEIAYAIRISTSMPVLMQPIEDNGSLLVDGDLQKSWPLWRLSKNLCPDNGRILEIRLEGEYEGKGQNAIDFMNTVYSCVTSLATDFIIDTYGHRDKFDYIKINTGSVIVVDFNISKEKREKLMEIGYQQTINYFKNYLPEKKKEILKYYKGIFKHVNKIKKWIFANKIKEAKNQLGLLYMEFSPSRKYIDLKYYDMVEDFKNVFLNDMVPTSILGFYFIKHPKLIKKQITSVVNKFEEKIIELENYNFKV